MPQNGIKFACAKESSGEEMPASGEESGPRRSKGRWETNLQRAEMHTEREDTHSLILKNQACRAAPPNTHTDTAEAHRADADTQKRNTHIERTKTRSHT